tara:strand:+ start:491 stop:751 length:261 start_codon:yes stop_codon:yes gene_type:complete
MAIKQPSKLTQQEVDSLNKLQQSNQQITFQFGQLSLEKLRLEEQERILKNSIENLKKEELKLAQELTNKYGKGSVNTETGEFTPAE